MDRIKIQAFPANVLVRKISLSRLKSLQKLSAYGNLLTGQLRGEAFTLHYGIYRQKQIPN